MLKQIKTIAAASLLLVSTATKAQLTISSGAVFNIQSGAQVTVQGDVLSSADITGTGNLILKGSTNQNVNMNGNIIPNLEMDNAAGATLTGNMKVNNSVVFTNGKIQLGSNTATLAAAATSAGMGASKFFETNGTGFVRRELAADISNSISPVGAGTDYLPVALTNTGSTYAGASIGVQAKGTANTNRHVRTESYLLAHWPINKIGITGGTTTAVGTYVDPTGISIGGTEADLKGFYWDGTNWSLTGSNQDNALNNVQATISTNAGELYGMNKFLLLNTKAYLQAAYNTATPGLMDDKLRTSALTYVSGDAPIANLIPSSDPYRTATYSPSFIHVNNLVAETVSSSVFNAQPNLNKNVVDWVFLELRTNAGAPTSVVATRSALLLRDGSIVDIDGVSPVYFKNADPANTLSLNVSVRHRNHLGLRSLTAKALDFIQSPAPSALDLAVNTNTLSSFGATLAAGVNGLYAGNINLNGSIRISGASPSLSDFESLKSIIGSLALIGNTYSQGDANMNRTVRISGASITLSDFEYLKSILGSLALINQPSY
jgi:hypothetical protein